MDQGQPRDSTPVAPVAAAAVRLPPYWDRNPRVFFIQAESQFQLAGITSQERKYHPVVSSLFPTAADEVYDVLSQPPFPAPYDHLKAALLQRAEASDRSRWQQLLSGEELGDRRPSQLLRQMTWLLGDRANGIDDGLLRELFFQRLPTNVQMVLTAAAPLPLAKLAVLADKVWEVSASSVANISATTSQTAGDTSKISHDIETPNSSQDFANQVCQRLEEVVLAATGR